MIEVYHLNNSRSQRILWLLEELELPYEIRRFKRDKETKLAPAELRNIHPLGKSPMIKLDGRLIVESGAIVETICGRYAPHMIPSVDTDAYISHLELMHFAEGSAMTPILLALYVSRLGEAAEPLLPRIREQLTSHYEYMEQMLRPSGHFVLDELSAVDIMLSFPAEIAIKQGRIDEFPKIAAHVKAMNDRPAYHRAMQKGEV